MLGSLDLFIGDARDKVMPLLRVFLLLRDRGHNGHPALLLHRLKLVDVHRCPAPWLDQLPRALPLNGLVPLPADDVSEVCAQARRLALFKHGVSCDSLASLFPIWHAHKG